MANYFNLGIVFLAYLTPLAIGAALILMAYDD
jgi:hypothetical protein